jgi:predicted O-methyltransferase YrrM
MAEREPTSEKAVSEWIESALEAVDPFREVALATERHRVEHKCDAYHTGDAHLLGLLAASVRARRVLEIGGALGYSALWLAYGSAPDGVVETIESDASHADLIRAHAAQYGFGERIRVLEGRDDAILPSLAPPYDLVFYDAYIPSPDLVDHFERLVRRGGVVVASNIFLGRYIPDSPDLAQGAAFRKRMLEDPGWQTSFANGKLVAVRR